MRSVGEAVERQVGAGEAGAVLGRRDQGGKDDPLRGDATARRPRPQRLRGGGFRLQQPEDGTIGRLEQPEPKLENLRRELEHVVERTEHERIVGEAVELPVERGPDRPLVVVGLIGVGEANDLLGEMRLVAWGDQHGVGDDVIDPGRAERARIAEPLDLQGRRPRSEHRGEAAFRPSLQVDQDVDLVLGDAAGGLRLRPVADVDDAVEGVLEPPAVFIYRWRGEVIADDLEPLPVLRLDHPGDEVGGRMVAEIPGKIADAQPYSPVTTDCRRTHGRRGRGHHEPRVFLRRRQLLRRRRLRQAQQQQGRGAVDRRLRLGHAARLALERCGKVPVAHAAGSMDRPQRAQRIHPEFPRRLENSCHVAAAAGVFEHVCRQVENIEIAFRGARFNLADRIQRRVSRGDRFLPAVGEAQDHSELGVGRRVNTVELDGAAKACFRRAELSAFPQQQSKLVMGCGHVGIGRQRKTQVLFRRHRLVLPRQRPAELEMNRRVPGLDG